jgi:hypothetical protein
MTDTLTPPEASGDAPAPLAPETLAPRPGRFDWRPKVRWFAAEIVVVVAGVLIALALNAWWGARQDAAREQEYLRQLVADLTQTEERIERGRFWLDRGDVAAAMLVRSFRSGSTPSADSVVYWASRGSEIGRATFVIGTATALVETGDLNLIRNDSLRSSITQYIDRIEKVNSYLAHNDEDSRPYIATLSERVDFGDAEIARHSPAELDSLARAQPTFPIPEAPRRPFAPLDVEALLRDREAYTAAWNLSRIRRLMAGNLQRGLGDTAALREQIEAELNR